MKPGATNLRVWWIDGPAASGIESVFVQRFRSSRQRRCQFHQHAFEQICLVRSGVAEVHLAGQASPLRLQTGDAVVFPAGQVHGWQEGARQPFDLLAVNLSAKIRLPSSALRLPTVLLKVDGDPAVLTLAGELERAGLSSRPGRNVLGAALALALRHALAQAAADASAAVPSEATRLVHKATEFMRMNLNRPLGQPELATALGVSSVRLARVFLRETGKSPVATLRQLRLAEVRRLLVETTLPLEAIALRTGLHGAQHLCRTFRRGTGLTPGAYRAGHRHAG